MPSPEELYPLLAACAAIDPFDAKLLELLAKTDETLGEASPPSMRPGSEVRSTR
jgi:uncharacterized membrane protein